MLNVLHAGRSKVHPHKYEGQAPRQNVKRLVRHDRETLVTFLPGQWNVTHRPAPYTPLKAGTIPGRLQVRISMEAVGSQVL